jgi:hypothetical protein
MTFNENKRKQEDVEEDSATAMKRLRVLSDDDNGDDSSDGS